MKSKKRIHPSIVVGCLLLLFSALVGARYATAEEDDAELLRPDANWSDAQHVSTTSGNGAFVPVLKVSSTRRVMIMYNHETAEGVENPFYAQSTDGGDTWSTPAPVHSSNTGARQVAFDFAGNTAHAVWRTGTSETSDSVRHAREGQWTANGSNLIVDTGQRVFDPEIAAGPDGVLHVVWTQTEPNPEDDKLYHSHSRNGGETWSEPQALTTGQYRASAPDIAVDQNGDVHVVWEERVPNVTPPPIFNYIVNYIKGNLTASGINWQQTQELAGTSEGPGVPLKPAIVAQGNDLHVGFSRRLEDNEQYPYYIGYSPGNGWDNQATNTSPGNPVDVNTTTPFYLVSTVAACSGTIYLYYHGAVDPNPREQVLGASSEGSWSQRVVVTDPDNRSIYPSIDCRSGTLHLAYAVIISTVDTNHQIYYLRASPTVYLPVIYSQ